MIQYYVSTYRRYLYVALIFSVLLTMYLLFASGSHVHIDHSILHPKPQRNIHRGMHPDDEIGGVPSITIRVRKSGDRGKTDWGWLKSFHSFSFGEYHDRAFERFGPLRVLNEDIIAPKSGFDKHEHSNFNIFTYVVEGELTHTDNLHKEPETIHKGEVQFTCAGRRIEHSERNEHSSLYAHILQIWMEPLKRNEPSYYKRQVFSDVSLRGKLTEIVSNVNKDAIPISTDCRVFASKLEKTEVFTYTIHKKRKLYLHLVNKASSQMRVHETILNQGDGAMIYKDPKRNQEVLTIQCLTRCEFLLFDLPE